MADLPIDSQGGPISSALVDQLLGQAAAAGVTPGATRLPIIDEATDGTTINDFKALDAASIARTGEDSKEAQAQDMSGEKLPATAISTDVTGSSSEPAIQPSAALQSLRSARFIQKFDDNTYPAAVACPDPALRSTDPMGNFRYDKNFLMQFQTVFTDNPSEKALDTAPAAISVAQENEAGEESATPANDEEIVAATGQDDAGASKKRSSLPEETIEDSNDTTVDEAVNQEMQAAQENGATVAQYAESELSSSLSAPDPDDEEHDPDWDATSAQDFRSSPRVSTRKRPSRASSGNASKRTKGSSRTRELEERLNDLEKSMQQERNVKLRQSSRQQQRPRRSIAARARGSSFEEHDCPNSDVAVCRSCSKEEKHITEFLLNHAWKHPWWEMLNTGHCQTCKHEKHEIVWGIQALTARGRMENQLLMAE